MASRNLNRVRQAQTIVKAYLAFANGETIENVGDIGVELPIARQGRKSKGNPPSARQRLYNACQSMSRWFDSDSSKSFNSESLGRVKRIVNNEDFISALKPPATNDQDSAEIANALESLNNAIALLDAE